MTEFRKRIGYCKMGRSLTIDKGKYGFQGDQEAPQLLERLAMRNPDVAWVIVGRTTEGKIDLPNVFNTWDDLRGPWKEVGKTLGAPFSLADKLTVGRFFDEHAGHIWDRLDGCVVHAGQHGTSNMPIPFTTSTWEQYTQDVKHVTNPQDSSVTYGGSITRGLNRMGDRTLGAAPVVWLVTDPRNYIKCRDVKWPTGLDDILAQYDWNRDQKHERFLDPRLPKDPAFESRFSSFNKPLRHGELWLSHHTYRYGGLELMILPNDWQTWGPANFHERLPAGVATTSHNDDRAGKEPRRSQLVRDVLLAAFPDAEVFGKWDKTSLTDLPEGRVQLQPPEVFHHLLNRWRVTMAMPVCGSSWTVAKVWQCFAGRVACFMYGRLDDQGWLLPTPHPKPIVNGRKSVTATKQVDDANDGLWSIRDDWTEQDIYLAHWLRVRTPDEFRRKAQQAASDPGTWQWIVDRQRDLLERRWAEAYVENEIERKLGL